MSRRPLDLNSAIRKLDISGHQTAASVTSTSKSTSRSYRSSKTSAKVSRPNDLKGIDNLQYDFLRDLFIDKWRPRTEKPPEIYAIYALRSPPYETEYENYRYKVDTKWGGLEGKPSNCSAFVSKMNFGNERFAFHGTGMACNLGKPAKKTRNSSGETIAYADKQLDFCDYDCNLCSICSDGFDTAFIKERGWLKLGKGIYTSDSSSKSHLYTEHLYKHSRYCVMIVCRIALGKPHVTHKEMPDIREPPRHRSGSKYDSVVAFPSPDYISKLANKVKTAAKNYTNGLAFRKEQAGITSHELVVYNHDAVMPYYLIVYKNPDFDPV